MVAEQQHKRFKVVAIDAYLMPNSFCVVYLLRVYYACHLMDFQAYFSKGDGKPEDPEGLCRWLSCAALLVTPPAGLRACARARPHVHT